MMNKGAINSMRLLIPLLFLSGCSSSPDGNGTQTANSPRSVSIIAPTSTEQPTTTATSTITNTPTKIPTLPPNDANDLMLSLLLENAGCKLPCVWGITPGKSTAQEGISILFPLSGISEFTDFAPGPGTIDPVYSEGDFYLRSSIVFLTPNNSEVINRVHVDFGPFQRFSDPTFKTGYGYYPLYNFPEFGKIAAFYMLPGILSRNGSPDSVYIKTMGKSGVEGMQYADFDLLLLYPDQGMLINYNAKKRVAGGNVLGCMANALVELELFPPDNGADFMDNLKGTDWESFRDGYKPLEELTSMTIESFYNTYSKPTDKCLSIPIDKLPVWYP